MIDDGPIASLWSLQHKCQVGNVWARIHCCVAAAGLVGGRYTDPDRHWPDAMQDLIGEQHRYRREEYRLIEGSEWQRANALLLERMNDAVHRWEQWIAEPDQETTMPTAPKTIKARMTGVSDLLETESPETFTEWQATLQTMLDWDDVDYQRRNDELLTLYHSHISAADAAGRIKQRERVPETQQQAAQQEAAVDGAELLLQLAPCEIAPAPWNPRQEFDAGELQELADSLKRHGVLQPIVVMRHPEWSTAKGEPRYVLIAGERRWRAATLAKLKRIPARLQDVTEEEAKEATIEENLRRKDLNPVEKARTVRLLIEDCGLTQAAAAKRLGYGNASQVANELFLLELPAAWQARVISREITPTHTRHLRSWIHREPVLDRIGQKLESHLTLYGESPTVKTFETLVLDAVHEMSRSLEKGHLRDACQFSVSKARLEQLDVAQVPQKWGGPPVERAFNVGLWDKLQREAKNKKRREANGQQSSATSGGSQPAKTHQPSGPHEHEIRECKVAWYRSELARVMEDAELEDLLRMVVMLGGSEGWYDELTMGIDWHRSVSGKPKLSRLNLSAVWQAIAQKPEGDLREILRDMVLRVLRAGGYLNLELDAFRVFADHYLIDYADQFTPPAELLAQYSAPDLRKMPQGKEAPEDLEGKPLAEWMAQHWARGSKLPKALQEPTRRKSR